MLIDIFSLKFPKEVKGILHLGAHECEERIKYLSRFNCINDSDIIWIDALTDKVKSLKHKYPSIQIYNECISDIDNQTISFNITNNYQSSSILKLKEHLIEHPDIHQISSIEMKTKSLKTFYNENNFNDDQFNFFALDIQGAELLALKGAGNILEKVDYIYIEVNTKELYENCALLDDIDSYLSKFNFIRQNILMTEHGWGDAFYVKKYFHISNNFTIYYGTDLNKIDITEIVSRQNNTENIINIPAGDENRARLYGDPIFGKLKSIFIETNNDSYKIDHNDSIYINTNDNILSLNLPQTKYKYQLSIMAIFKNETMTLRLWLEHYLWQGVEHFYLIDNDSSDYPLHILQEYIDKGIVSYFVRPEKYKQPEHYRNIFDENNLKENTKWLIICDLDEFFFGTEKKLITTLYDLNHYDVINTTAFFYGCDNNIEHPKDIRISNIHRNDDTVNGNKYIFKPSCIKDSSEIWIHWLVIPNTLQKNKYDNEIFENVKIRLNHYPIQSLKYFQNIKMTRGDVSKPELENIRNMELFEFYKKTAIIKDDILKNIIENDLYIKNGQEMKFYDENGIIIDNIQTYEDITHKINITIEPQFQVEGIDDKIYSFENVINYNYAFLTHPEAYITVRHYNSINTNNEKAYYIILDSMGYDAFAHWIHEIFIFFEIVKVLTIKYPDVKIVTTNKKRYVKNFLDFVGINNTIVYEIDNYNNRCFFMPTLGITAITNEDNKYKTLYNKYIQILINNIDKYTIDYKFTHNLLYLPRNLHDNYYPNDRLPEHLLHERRNQKEIDFISTGVINNNGIILDTYNINNIYIQFSIIKNSKNIILDYGSSFHVNCLFLKGKNIIVLNPTKMNHHNELPFYIMFTNRIMENNNVTILTDYNNYEDIQKYIK